MNRNQKLFSRVPEEQRVNKKVDTKGRWKQLQTLLNTGYRRERL